MPPTCSACRSNKLAAIDEGIVRGVRLAVLAKQVGLSRFVLIRHREHRLGKPQPREEHVVVAPTRPGADAFFKKIERLERITEKELKKASRRGKSQASVLAVRELARLAAMSAAASGANAPPAISTDVGKLLMLAAQRAREEHEREWAFVRGKNAAELLRDALRIVELGSDGEGNNLSAARLRVAKAAEALESEASVCVREYATKERVVETEVVETEVVVEPSEPTESENIVAFRAPVGRIGHTCGGRPDTFNCPRCYEQSQDSPDPRDGWFS